VVLWTAREDRFDRVHFWTPGAGGVASGVVAGGNDRIREVVLLSGNDLLDALSQQVAILDEHARILSVNAAWRRYRTIEEGEAQPVEGTSYLDVCFPPNGIADSELAELERGIRSVMVGVRTDFHHDYRCGGPEGVHWFRMHVTRVSNRDRPCLVVVHDDITDRKTVENALGERVKELNCLYRISELMTDPDLTQDEVLQAAVDLIPRSWRFPEIAEARIVIRGRGFRTSGFRETPWMQSAEMLVAGEIEGRVDVCYLEDASSADGVPFLPEERALIDAIAEQLGRYIERELAEENLRFNEARLNSLLQLFQRSGDLDEKDIIQLALEEAVKLTGSAIGYCHLVHEDQQAIELVTWSRDTLRVCEAVHDTHYPLTEAGVWADCARIKAPVVHNDYPSYPDRKGLPSGHAPLVRHLSVPVVEDGTVSVIMGVGNKADEYDESDVRQLQLVANDAWQIVRRKRVESQLRVMATTDALTGLANRRHFFERGVEEVERVRRYGGALALLMLDIDAFKVINDSYGHDVGDSVLADFSGCVRRSLRDVDIIGRVGGEEFAVLLPSTALEEARGLAERLVAEVRKMGFTADGSSFGITVSIGVAACGEGVQAFGELFKAADVALYRAKEAGRDCVVA
jgi:diguanylate cyclase (GGDEF)-like protein